jgi:transposase
MKAGLLGRQRISAVREDDPKEAGMELYVGADLSRKRVDWQALWPDGAECAAGAAPPDRDGLAGLAARLRLLGDAVVVIESMTGARFVHDELERHGLDVRIADARKAKVAGELLGQVGAKTDRLDARLLAELGRRDLVPEIWLADPATRCARERSRFRLHLVRHRTSLKNRIHQTLITHGIAARESDLFGVSGRARLALLTLPEPWQTSVRGSLELIDHLDQQITEQERLLRREGADHPYLPLLMTAPGIGWVLGYAIASELGDINRFASWRKLVGYSGLCPRVEQSGESDRRGPLRKNGPKWLRWALVEAATHACSHPVYRELYQSTKTRLGKQRGPRVAQITIARKLAEASWYMLTRQQPFAPAGATLGLAP